VILTTSDNLIRMMPTEAVFNAMFS
jgi:hypothetical protein